MDVKQVLENEKLLIEIHESGAELCRIYDKEHKREVLWDANPKVWNRHAPVLFPVVGQCYGQKYRIDKREYPMSQHGFARDAIFTLESKTEDEVWYQLEDSTILKEKYPFSFRLQIGHKLDLGHIKVMWKVINTDTSKDMYFQIGGHPAFVVPEGTEGFMKLLFPGKNTLNYEILGGDGFVVPKKMGTLRLNKGVAEIDSDFYDVPTYIFNENQVDVVTLAMPDGKPYVTLHCQGFPYLGIWSKDSKRFHCLEPWFGRCDYEGFEGDIKEKVNILTLKPGQVFDVSYKIEIH